MSANRPDPDALLASKKRSTGTGCSFARLLDRLPDDLAEAVARWLTTDPDTGPSSEAIADAVTDFDIVYGLDFPTSVTAGTIARHRPKATRARKCRTCGVR